MFYSMPKYLIWRFYYHCTCYIFLQTDTNSLDEDIIKITPSDLDFIIQEQRRSTPQASAVGKGLSPDAPNSPIQEQRRRSLQANVKAIVRAAKENNETFRFYSKTGRICIQPITQEMDKELLKHFSTKEIRMLIEKAFKEK